MYRINRQQWLTALALAIGVAPSAVAQVSLHDVVSGLSAGIRCVGIDTPLCSNFRFFIGAGPHSLECDLGNDGEFCGDGDAFSDAHATLTVQLDQSFSAEGQLVRVVSSGSVAAGHPGAGGISAASVGFGVTIPFEITVPTAFSISNLGGSFGSVHSLDDEGNNLGTSGILAPGSYDFEVLSNRSFFSNQSPSSFAFDDSSTLRLGSASEFRWITPNGGLWSTPSNWDVNQVPSFDSGDKPAAIFDLGGALAIDASGVSKSAGQMLVRNTAVDLFTGLLTLQAPTITTPSVAISGPATLGLQLGRLNGVDVVVGGEADPATATLALIGTASNPTTLEASGTVLVGFAQPADLNVTDATLDCETLQLAGAGVGSVADLRGPDAQVLTNQLDMGVLGSANMLISDGATVFGTAVDLGVGPLGASAIVIDGVNTLRNQPSILTAGALNVGLVASGEVVVRGGAKLTADELTIGPGIATLSGASSTGNFTGSNVALGALTLGRAGLGGTLTIADGAILEPKPGSAPIGRIAAQSLLRVTGVNTSRGLPFESSLRLTELSVGSDAAATFEILDGGFARLDRLTLGSDDPAAAPVLNVTGQSQSISSLLVVESTAQILGDDARVTVSEGGHVNFKEDVEIRPHGQAFFNVIGPNSVCTVDGRLTVAGRTDGAIASVIVSEGGIFSQSTGFLASLVVGEGSSTGDILITYPIEQFTDPIPSQMRLDEVEIASGQILVQGAGRLGADQTLIVRDRLEVDTNLLNSRNVVCNTLIIKAAGVVRCCPHGHIVATTIINEPGARIEGSANITGNVVTGGLVRVGCSPGTMFIEGDYEQLPGGRLEIEYAGTNPGEFDVLHVTGQTTLGGRLEVHFRGGFSPDNPEAFVHAQDFVEADQGIVGDYAERVFVYPDRFADFDDDGDKDLSDLAAFQNCFGLAGKEFLPECRVGDWENDGEIGNREVRELSSRLAGPG